MSQSIHGNLPTDGAEGKQWFLFLRITSLEAGLYKSGLLLHLLTNMNRTSSLFKDAAIHKAQLGKGHF
jgi:hypothetical protein